MEQNQTTATPGSNIQKKFPSWLIVVIIIIVILLAAWYFWTNSIRNKIINSLPEGVKVETNDNTYKVKTGDTETVVSEEKIVWPAELSDDLPKFQGGKIKAVSRDVKTSSWVILISDTTQAEYNNYKTYLMNANWDQGQEVNTLVDMVSMTKGDMQVTVVFDKSSNGVSITLTKDQK